MYLENSKFKIMLAKNDTKFYFFQGSCLITFIFSLQKSLVHLIVQRWMLSVRRDLCSKAGSALKNVSAQMKKLLPWLQIWLEDPQVFLSGKVCPYLWLQFLFPVRLYSPLCVPLPLKKKEERIVFVTKC